MTDLLAELARQMANPECGFALRSWVIQALARAAELRGDRDEARRWYLELEQLVRDAGGRGCA